MMKASLGTFDKYWIQSLESMDKKFVAIVLTDKAGHSVDAWSNDPEKLRAIAADLIKGAEYLEGIEPGQTVNEVDDLRQQLQASQELNRALSAQVEGNDGELPK